MDKKKVIALLILITLIILVFQLFFTENKDLNYPFIFLAGGAVAVGLVYWNEGSSKK